MENRGLLFIPDISGFTRFVSRTDIEHSRLIIQELLETLINANQMGLTVSEIEGDAILFYQFGQAPTLEEVYRQVEKMFREFHRSLMTYEHRRYCYCKACNAAVALTLKIVTHYGEFTGYNVKNFNKLIGRDVIVAHRLLKNEISQHEYWLVTPSLAGAGDPPARFGMEWQKGALQTEEGEIPFHYAQLGHLKKEILPEAEPQWGLPEKVKMLSFSREYDADIITLFHVTGDFNFRHRWQVGVKAVEEIDHHLPRRGMKCRCVMEDGDVVIYSSSYSFNPERISFSETNEAKTSQTAYTLEKIGDKKSRLTLDFYLRKNPVRQLLFPLTGKKKLEAVYLQSLTNLERLVREIRLPDRG